MLTENRPYDELVRQILTASGSNQTTPPASYYKVLRTPKETMENTTQLFLERRTKPLTHLILKPS